MSGDSVRMRQALEAPRHSDSCSCVICSTTRGGTTATAAFESIRHCSPEGREFWSARDLMPLLGYAKWERFADAIARAKVAASNAGYDVAQNFPTAGKVSGLRGPAQADYHLSRYACYLIALNGDPRKPEIAAAQTYFVIKTRQAETTPAVAPTGPELLAMAVLEAQQVLAARDATIAELKPRAAVANQILDADDDYSVKDAANVLTRAGIDTGQNRLFNELARRAWIYRRPGDQAWHPYQRAITAGWLSVMPQSHYHPRTGVLVLDPPQIRIRPKGLQKLLTDMGATAPTTDLSQ